MKKNLLLVSLGVILAFTAVAQKDLKPFKFDLSLGYAIPGGSGSKGGILFAAEPKFAVIPKLAVGLRMEVAVMARGVSGVEDTYDEVEVKASGSYLATADYYFTENYSFRPFVGAGAGIYSLAAATVNEYENEYDGSSKTKFGGMVRGGLETRHFRFGLEYNIVPKTTYVDYNGSGKTITAKNGYVGIKVGICIGGGPR
jgi:opacity protein-like surface antigen